MVKKFYFDADLTKKLILSADEPCIFFIIELAYDVIMSISQLFSFSDVRFQFFLSAVGHMVRHC